MTTAADLADTWLDRSIVLGYGRTGLEIRRHLPGWPSDPPRMEDQVVLVTGAGSGIGLAACQGFARQGAGVHALARNQKRADDAVSQIVAAAPGADVRGWACDVSSLSELRDFGHRFQEVQARLDVLVNNAGVMPDQRQRSVDGHELMFATHVLAPFALTAMLSQVLRRSVPARVINVSSGGMDGQGLPGDDLQSERDRYSPKKLYARTKREQVVITEQWAERLRPTGVVVHAMHPGWADTKGVQEWLPVFRTLTRPIIRSARQGADTIVWLGAAPQPLNSTGRFWHDRRTRPTHYRLGAGVESDADRQALWDLCESLLHRAHIATDTSPGRPDDR